MDHISLLLGLQTRPPEIPYLPYNEGTILNGHLRPFESLSSRYGVNNIQCILQLKEAQTDKFQRIVQSWLYFDLLEDFFPNFPCREDFVTKRSDCDMVSSKRLAEYCFRTTQQPGLYDDKRCREKLEVLQFVTLLANRIDEWDPSVTLQHQSKLIVCSVKILVETLSSFLLSCWPTSPDPPLSLPKRMMDFLEELFYPMKMALESTLNQDVECSHDGSRGRRVKPTPACYLMEELRRGGYWCPKRLRRMRSQLDSICLYVLLIRGHGTTSDRNEHSQCGEEFCQADRLSPQGYNPRHSTRCLGSNCKLVSVSTRHLNDIYQRSANNTKFPILSCDSANNIRVESNYTDEYYAISHIWSEGLGNESNNAILACQLEDIVEQVRKTRQAKNFAAPPSERIYIWLDTLCIPPTETHTGAGGLSSKKIAIQKIDLTFASAASVIVRENSLQEGGTNFFELSWLDQAFSLYNMKWLDRCWTLAEATAAWELYISIQGRSVNLHRLVEDIKRSAQDQGPGGRTHHPPMSPTLRGCIYQRITTALLGPIDVLNNGKTGNLDLFQTWNALLDRTTTKAADIPGILAMANALSPKEIVSLPAREDRLKAVLNMFQELPAAFLFNAGPRLKDDPRNRWFPASLESYSSRITTPETIETYHEGKMVGPLSADKFPHVYFTGQLSQCFHLRTFHHDLCICLHELPSNSGSAYTEWCLVLPSTFIAGGFLRSTSCTGFCAMVERRSRRASKSFIVWEVLADILIDSNWHQCSARTTLDAEEAHAKSAVYIACDMTNWPSPIALRQYFSLVQERQIFRQRARVITNFYLGVTIVELAFAASYILSPSITIETKFFVLLIVGCLQMSAIHLARKQRHTMPTVETSARTHKRWQKLFLNSGERSASSFWFRYYEWLRRLRTPLRHMRIDESIIILEVLSCSMGIFIATYLAVFDPDHQWFVVDAIIAWLAFFGVPIFWAHRLYGAAPPIFSDMAAEVVLAVGASLSIGPLLAYSDLGKVTKIMCYIIVGSHFLHMSLIFFRYIVYVNSVTIDQSQKNRATLKQVMGIKECEGSAWQSFWEPVRFVMFELYNHRY